MRAALDRWLFDTFTASPEGLGLYRILYASFVLFAFTPGHAELLDFSFVGALPNAFFLPPPGPLMLLPGPPPSWLLDALHLLLTGSLVALLVGYRTRWASWAVFGLLLTGYGFAFSVGKINHVMLFVLLPLVMSLTNWGAAYSMDAQAQRTPRAVQTWPLALLALLIGFAMFTAGFSKLIGGWLDPTTQATQGHFVKQFFARGRQDFLAPWLLQVDSVVFWELLDWGTVLFEMGFLVAVVRKQTMRLFLAAAIGFHLGTLLMLNIAFVFNYIVYAAFISWGPLAKRLQDGLAHLPNGAAAPRLILLVGAVGTLGLWAYGSPLLWGSLSAGLVSDLTWIEVGCAAVAVAVVLAEGGRYLRNVLHRTHRQQHPTMKRSG
ncbi:hypothetical protein CRI93_03225 [Longimonas halophila]|uniref:HTTM-like domain-containing protein n=1 Tax=Longimonas halophila TaxID=1469170 RepID=A0A2H3P092_9BACT|nr:HTTM domain-containing protein [Longimonas halophila]PEN08783.1 hypothetical protein CRI93_03225 [Longimonas halophila]